MFGLSRKRTHPVADKRPICQPGTYVGPAIFRPARTRDLRDDLRQEIGKVVELQFVTVAGAEERWAGQNIYMERPGSGSVLHGAWVADEDVQFLEPSRGRIERADEMPSPEVQRLLEATADAPLVLLVDDSRDTRDLYGFVLTHAGFQVIDADDGLRALELARRTHPDAIVMDINLPQMNGLDAIKLLRAEPETSRTPILVFTAYGATSAGDALRTGANARCLKPCLPEVFLDSLRSILPAGGEAGHAR
jgi:two-component system, chemotaxis family, chemotaxis protein CheY